MKFFKRRGKRIKEKDASLVLQYIFISVVGVWLLSFIPFHLSFLITSKWQLEVFQAHFISSYGLMTLLFSLVITAACVFVYYRYGYNHFKQMIHRQKLSKMILENGWYETKQVAKESLFKDIPFDKAKEKISHFPKAYYRFEKGLLYIQVEITLGKFQEPLLNLEKKLESGLYCELVSKELHDSYVEYVLFL